MAYLVLARKYRPQSFKDVLGQEHVTRTLENAIKTNHIAHAYLFSGPRGVGKTTTARIFAKALNCEKGLVTEPCQTCSACKEITAGTSMDVIEIDGGSTRGINEIRELRNNVRFAPASVRYKVYIIDEVHQITSFGFNALLKTLEEPPAHVKFMMATTEPHELPRTIISRLQHFTLKLVPIPLISKYLDEIIEKERGEGREIKVTKEALDLIAKNSGGSVRDAQSLLDQAISYGGDKVGYEEVSSLLGLIPSQVLHDITQCLSAGRTSEVLELLETSMNNGYDVHQLTKDLRDYYRKMLLLKYSSNEKNVANLGLSNELKELVRKTDAAHILRGIKLLVRCAEEMKWSEYPGIVLETTLAWLSKKVVSIETLMQGSDTVVEEPEKEKVIDKVTPVLSEEQKTDMVEHKLFSLWEQITRRITGKNLIGESMRKAQHRIENNKIVVTVTDEVAKHKILKDIRMVKQEIVHMVPEVEGYELEVLVEKPVEDTVIVEPSGNTSGNRDTGVETELDPKDEKATQIQFDLHGVQETFPEAKIVGNNEIDTNKDNSGKSKK